MSKLAAVHLPELWFGKFGHLKDDSQSCLAQSNLQESVNLQSFKNRIHNIIFSHYAQETWNVTSWHLEDINVQVSPKLCPWTSLGNLQWPPKFPTVSSLAWLSRRISGKNLSATHKYFQPVNLWTWLLFSWVLL